MRLLRDASIVLGLIVIAAAAGAVDLPVLEEFPSNNRNWIGGNTNMPLTHEGAGGPDGGAYVTTEFIFNGFSNPFGGGPVIFRAHQNQNASQHAFEGDWFEDGVGRVRAWVRQDTGLDLTYFVRFANPSNAPPAAVVDDDDTVPSGVWTQIEIEIDPDDPSCQGEGVTCAQAMANVGNFQIGTNAPAPLPTTNAEFTFDVDKVELLEVEVPEPSQAVLALVGALAMAGARRLGRI
jgi:hypothetical protein